MRMPSGRTLTIRGAAVALALIALLPAACNKAGGGGGAGGAADISQDMTLSKAEAPVTVVEYASASCAHCARWNAEVFPNFKAKYVDTGKVHYVMREVNIHGAADVAGYLLARCVEPSKYFHVIDAIMRAQPALGMQLENAQQVYQDIGRSSGLTDQQFQTCLSDPKRIEALNARMEKEQAEFDVRSTPTFVINGKKMDVDHPPSLEELSAVIDPQLTGAKK